MSCLLTCRSPSCTYPQEIGWSSLCTAGNRSELLAGLPAVCGPEAGREVLSLFWWLPLLFSVTQPLHVSFGQVSKMWPPF